MQLLWIYLLAVDVALITLGILGFGVQISYDSQLTTPWNTGGGILSPLYMTSDKVMFDNYTFDANVDGIMLNQYQIFWGFWGGLSAICNMSQYYVNKNNVYGLVLSLYNHQCIQRGWSTLWTNFMSFRACLILMGITILLQCLQIFTFSLYHFNKANRIVFGVFLLTTKLVYLIAFSMYFLYLHNRNLSYPDPMPNTLSNWLLSATIIYWIILISNSIAFWVLSEQDEDYELLQ